MSAVRVAIVDDDVFRASGMSALLNDSTGIEVVLVVDQDAVDFIGVEVWRGIDVAIVEVKDEASPGEIGTDMYSGIQAIETIARHGVRTVAIVPSETHPLVELRIAQAGTNFVYLAHEVTTVPQLEHIILSPDDTHRPVHPPVSVLEEFGAVNARPNDAVQVYQDSRIHGCVGPMTELDDLPIHRHTVSKFRVRIRRTGFTGTEFRTGPVKAPRWPDVRDYLLRILGRAPKP